MASLPADWPRAPIDFRVRADLPEIMDDDGLDPAIYAAVIADLARVNSLTRARPPTLAWLRRQTVGMTRFTLVDVGFGHGDMLRAIAGWAQRHGIAADLVGVDLNPRSAPVAVAATDPVLGIRYVTGRAEALDFAPDFIISSLVAHHMRDAELVGFLRWMDGAARAGWLVNDLHRHPLAWAGFRALAAVLGWHPIVAHDGALSVRRAFTRADWTRLLGAAGVQADVRWHLPFRWTVASCRR
ncbi:methyltransferase domain-containing protein [Sandarakinorhabdus rubra]|uniref:methyltransferase domain-containing protein n=1 Tax=Sandarakinorhabdus rubra TaxID=2672568 RepID=UPI001969AC7A|nr:methyltransferase domain-containing protein [Sandarakinorhabdus rubra]